MFSVTKSLKTIFGTKVPTLHAVLQLKFLVNASQSLDVLLTFQMNIREWYVSGACVFVCVDMKVNINIYQSSFFLLLMLTQKQ